MTASRAPPVVDDVADASVSPGQSRQTVPAKVGAHGGACVTNIEAFVLQLHARPETERHSYVFMQPPLMSTIRLLPFTPPPLPFPRVTHSSRAIDKFTSI